MSIQPTDREPTHSSPVAKRVMAAVTLVGVVVILATFRDYGITWDEPVQSHYGEGVLRYFQSGLTDRSIDEFLHMRFYGPLFELVAALAYAPIPDAKYEVRHLLIALTGLLAVVGVARLATLFPSRWVAVYAPLALIALPRFYGHAFNNSKDIPFACAFVWAIDATCRLAVEPVTSPHRRRRIALCGALLGATLATRPGGLPLLLLLFTAITGAAVFARTEAHLRRTALESGAVWALAWLGMVVLWPWAHESPIENPVRAVAAALSFPDTFPVLFEGVVTMSDALPRYYLAKYLWITTPPAALALAAGGLVWTVRTQLRQPKSTAALAAFAIQLWLFVPLALATVGRPNVYDGMRHLLFALPALALLAGAGAAWAVESVRGEHLQRVAAGALLAACLWPLGEHVRLHPYQSAYFNAFVGGLGGASGRYETDYWLASYKEAIEWVNDRAAADPARGVDVLVAADRFSLDCAARFIGPGVRLAHTAEKAVRGEIPEPFDYYVATTRYGLSGSFPDSPIAHSVERSGAALTVVRRRARFDLADR